MLGACPWTPVQDIALHIHSPSKESEDFFSINKFLFRKLFPRFKACVGFANEYTI